MATSGQLNTNTTYESYFWVRWAIPQNGQNVASNKTKINWSCGVYCGHSFYSNAIKMSAFSINGVQVYGGGTYSNFDKGEHQVAYGSLDISHNSDGTKTFAISSFTGWLYSSHNYSCNGGSYDLPSIPRQATLTAAPDFTDLQNPAISYSNPAGNAVTALEACISLTGAMDDIAYRAISKTGSSYTFPLTDAERDVLRNNTTGPNRTVYFYVRTKIGNIVYHSSLPKILTIAESDATRPTVSMTLSPVNSLSKLFNGLYIQGKSKVKATVQVTMKYSASVVSSVITVEGVNYGSPYESGVFSKDGTQAITATVKDSRNFYATVSQNISVIPYSKPSVESADCYRSDGNGKKTGTSTSLWLKAKRVYSTVDGKNACALQWRVKMATEAWNDTIHYWNDLLAKTDTTTEWYDALLPNAVFDTSKAYTIQVRAIDDIGEAYTRTFDIPTEDVALHLGKGGKNVAIGTYCDYSKDHTFHSAWDATFAKSINGLYIKTVYISPGTTIRLQSVFTNWDTNSGSRQSFFVFGSMNGTPIMGVCIARGNGLTPGNSINNCTASCEEGGVVVLTMSATAYDYFTIISPQPFTIL